MAFWCSFGGVTDTLRHQELGPLDHDIQTVEKTIRTCLGRAALAWQGTDRGNHALRGQPVTKFIEIAPVSVCRRSEVRIEIRRPDGSELVIENIDTGFASEVAAGFLGVGR